MPAEQACVSSPLRLALALVLAFLAPGCLENVQAPPPAFPDTDFSTPSEVTVVGNRLYANGVPFVVKGVTYSPIPPGIDPEGADATYDWIYDPGIWKRDLPLLKEMGANTVRVVHASADASAMRPFLDEAARLHVRVIVGHPGPVGEDAGDPVVRDRTKREVVDLVAAYRDHPAVLMWLVGNEVNYWYPDGKDVADWYTLLEEVAREAKRLDPDHPVATANNALKDVDLFATLSPSVDVYGTNQYAPDGREFDNIVKGFTAVVPDKPILVTEFGADAWDSKRGREDEETQAAIVRGNWEIMMEHSGGGAQPFIGACVFEWSDEWWKGGDPSRPDPDASWKPPHADGVLPDGTFSEAYFGIVRVSPGGDVEKRLVFDALKSEWATPDEESPPAILNLRSETNGNRIHVTADVHSYGGTPVDVSIRYRVRAGAWESAPMAPVGDHAWTAELGPYDGVSVLFYRVLAVDDAGRETRSPEATAHAVPGVGGVAVLVAIGAAALVAGAHAGARSDGAGERERSREGRKTTGRGRGGG